MKIEISLLAAYFAGFFMTIISTVALNTPLSGEFVFLPLASAFWPVSIWLALPNAEPISVFTTAAIVGIITFFAIHFTE